MAEPHPAISVVILNFNGSKFLHACIQSVMNQGLEGIEIIMVDNASSDDSCSVVESCYPEVRILKLDRNYHFSGGMNRGVHAAHGEFVLLLNNDTIVYPGCFARILSTMTEHRADFCGVRIMKPDGERSQSCNTTYETLDFAGAAVFVRRSVFEDIGGIDESFKTYFELKDFAVRLVLMGYRSMVEPAACVFHVGSSTTKKLSGYAVTNMSRNLPALVIKNFSTGTASEILLFYAISRSALIAMLIAKGRSEEIKFRLRGYAEFAKLLPELMEKRRTIQKRRKCSDLHIAELREKRLYKIGVDGSI